MEPTKDKLNAELIVLEKAVKTLEEVLALPLTDVVRDATIQRFEYTFELSWKTIQTAANFMGTTCNSPREAIKFAFKSGWTRDVDGWFQAMEARNKTSHAYNIKLATEVYEVAKKYPALIKELILLVKKV